MYSVQREKKQIQNLITSGIGNLDYLQKVLLIYVYINNEDA